MTRARGFNGQDRAETRRVKIVEVNLNAPTSPVAIGRDIRKFTGGLLYQIDLAHGIGDQIVVPRPGDIWWITKKVGAWTLDHRESKAEARSGGTPSPSPAGAVVAYAGAEAPLGWLACDGTAVSRSIYSDLFDAIGTNYGKGDGANTFNLPDLRGRFPFGWVGDGYAEQFTAEKLSQPKTSLVLGEAGGTRGWIDHSHPIQSSRYAGAGGGAGPIPDLRTDVQDHIGTRVAGTQLTTGGRLPYLTLNFIIKT